ncbi:hypothetical protein [Desmospora activa]|uniref:Uncharacterized protein n=1 Tax=Desmospora activa DSM 45169 TaxID=1121389 RepID=A0A2T4Z8B2_9BACL|nr:hypothetical protein [Desmospora activa]PTM58141.1 hypothetical protein C8J48_0717 [Desmospora activa DSM 45169]
MKKILAVVTVLVMGITIIPSVPAYAEGEPQTFEQAVAKSNEILRSQGKEPLSKEDYLGNINKALEKALEKDEAQRSEYQAQGSEYKVTVPVNGNSNLFGKVTIESEEVLEALGTKSWKKTISFDEWVGVRWDLVNSGTFTYGKKSSNSSLVVIKGATYNVDAKALPPYSASDTSRLDKLSGAVWEVKGKGKYSQSYGNVGATYHGYLDVRLHATGNVSVQRAKFDF